MRFGFISHKGTKATKEFLLNMAFCALTFCALLLYAYGVMKMNFQAVIERDCTTGLLVGYVPGFAGAHAQGESLDALSDNLREVIAILLEDGGRSEKW